MSENSAVESDLHDSHPPEQASVVPDREWVPTEREKRGAALSAALEWARGQPATVGTKQVLAAAREFYAYVEGEGTTDEE